MQPGGYLPAGSSHLGSSRPNEAPRWRCPLEWHRPPHRGNMSIPVPPRFQDGEQTAGVLRPKAVGWLPYISSKRSPAHHCPANTPRVCARNPRHCAFILPRAPPLRIFGSSLSCVCVYMLSCFSRSDSLQPHGLQPTRLLHPLDSPGKSTGVGCHCLGCSKNHSKSEVYNDRILPQETRITSNSQLYT